MKNNKLSLAIAASLFLSSGAALASDKQCSDVIYDASVTAEFPEIQDACRGVVERNGKEYTKLVAHIGRKDRMNRTRLQLRMSDDSLGKSHHIKAPKNLSVSTESGDKISWDELAPNQDITLYVPHDRWAFVAIDEDEAAPVEEIAIVEAAEELPKTASSLHVPAIFAGLFMLFGSLLTVRRKFFK